MSIKAMIRVWDQSQHKGTELLALLALADWANDDGVTYYGNAKIAQRLRTEERAAQRKIAALRASGELYAPPRPGRKTTTKFITVGLSEDEITAVLVERFRLPEEVAEVTAAELVGLQQTRQDGHLKHVKTDTLNTSEQTPQTRQNRHPIHVKTDTLNTSIQVLNTSERTPDPLISVSDPPNYPKEGDPHRERETFVFTQLEPGNAVDARTIAIAKACLLDLGIPQHRDKCEQAAAQLFRFSAEEIKRRYWSVENDWDYDGWKWFEHDWRGKKGDVPTPRNIVATITLQKPATVPNGRKRSGADVVAAALGGSAA